MPVVGMVSVVSVVPVLALTAGIVGGGLWMYVV